MIDEKAFNETFPLVTCLSPPDKNGVRREVQAIDITGWDLYDDPIRAGEHFEEQMALLRQR